MAAPTHPTSTSDLWHLSIEDLLAPQPQTPKLGGAGPFVINLTASTAPLSPPKDFTLDESTHVYQVQKMEDHRMRYRLRIGPFATEEEADAALGKVRDTYPGALTATAETEDLRAILSWQAKRAALRLAAERAQEAMKSEPVPFEIAPIPVLTAAVATRRAGPAPAPAPAAAAAPSVPAAAPAASAAAPLPRARAPRASVPVSMGAGARLQSLAALNLSPISTRAFATRMPRTVAAPAAPRAHSQSQSPSPRPTVAAPAAPSAAPSAKTASAPPAAVAVSPILELSDVLPALGTVMTGTGTAVAGGQPPAAGLASPTAPSGAGAHLSASSVVAPKPAMDLAGVTNAARAPRGERSALLMNGVPAARRSADPSLPNVPSFESTQTVRALTPIEIESLDTPRWYVIQLGISDTAFDPESLPNCDIFNEYRLYSVTGFDQGREIHALRLGFFGEEVAAAAVASYLAAFYEAPTIKRVSTAERERFADHRLEARKDIGATGKHAVIEITNERIVRERREGAISAK